VKLSGEQLVLDTNILVYWLRGKAAGQTLLASYGLDTRRPRPVVPIVVKGEIRALGIRLGWGENKLARLDAVLRELLALDISSEDVLAAYAYIARRVSRWAVGWVRTISGSLQSLRCSKRSS
jgi:rRNA-processing protein FCF1